MIDSGAIHLKEEGNQISEMHVQAYMHTHACVHTHTHTHSPQWHEGAVRLHSILTSKQVPPNLKICENSNRNQIHFGLHVKCSSRTQFKLTCHFDSKVLSHNAVSRSHVPVCVHRCVIPPVIPAWRGYKYTHLCTPQ